MKLDTGTPARAMIGIGSLGALSAVMWHQGVSWPGTAMLWVIIILLAGVILRMGRRGPPG